MELPGHGSRKKSELLLKQPLLGGLVAGRIVKKIQGANPRYNGSGGCCDPGVTVSALNSRCLSHPSISFHSLRSIDFKASSGFLPLKSVILTG